MTRRRWGQALRGLSWGGVLLALTSCGVVRFDDATLSGRRAAVEEVHRLLTNGECEKAVVISTKLYESDQSDNEVRYAHMAAQACSAGISNFITLVLAMANGSGMFTTPGGLWVLSTQLFYQSSTSGADARFQAGLAAAEAGSAILKPGVTVSLTNLLNPLGFNPGSLLPEDREANANFYRMFLSLANMGNAQTRYGSPDSVSFSNGATYLGATASNSFGWSLVSAVDDSACGYAASVVEFVDNIAASASSLPSSLSGPMATLASLYGPELDTACSRACQSLGPVAAHPVDYSGLGCPLIGNDRLVCSGIDSNHPCLAALRNRKLCATRDANTVLDDQARCAAAGIAHYISTHPILGWL